MTENDRTRLLEAAREAAHQAYTAETSHEVGAAALTADGEIYSGCNIENANVALTMCAERVALFKAVSEGAAPIMAIAIAANGGGAYGPAFPPCGACRQVMSEFLDRDSPVIIDGVGETEFGTLFRVPFDRQLLEEGHQYLERVVKDPID